MAFVRLKRIRGREYAYLVASQWDRTRRTSRQVTLKYLGPVEGLTLEDIPSEYRTRRVVALVGRRSAQFERRRGHLVDALTARLAAALAAGDPAKSDAVSREALEALGLDGFYARVATPAMHRIGDLWKAGDLSISQEHLASNIMATIVERTNAGIRRGRPRGTAALCVPQGELHNLATKVLEGLLAARGFRSLNVSASAPTESIADFIASKEPDAVLVSLTVPEFLPSARRLVRAFAERLPGARIVVGGQGVRESAGDFPPGAVVVTDGTLAALDALRPN